MTARKKRTTRASSSRKPKALADPSTGAETAPELQRLEAEAAQVDAENPDDAPIGGEQSEQAAGAVDELQEARDFFRFCRDTLSQAWPFVADAYSNERCDAIAGAWLPLANKYGWQLSQLLGPEVLFAIAVLAPVPELARGHQLWKEKQRQLNRMRQPATPMNPPSSEGEASGEAWTVTQPGGNGAG
jgi:hypothetical protein